MREQIRAEFARLFAKADLLLTPIAGVCRPSRSATPRRPSATACCPSPSRRTSPGLPSCAVPVGFDDLGLPVGVQLTGPAHSEGRVLAAAEALFSATASARAESASTR